jgi:uncharacterized protein YbjT (DUF2867 family)
MNVALTGATGFIGSHILTELRRHDHEVTALVRDDAQAAKVAAAGATPAVVDLYDTQSVTSLLSGADAAIHTASPGDATSANMDSVMVDYVIGDGLNPTVAELTEAAAVAADAPGAVPGTDDEAKARIGDYLAGVLLLDQGTDAAKAREEFGWYPSHPALVDDFRHGSYRK